VNWCQRQLTEEAITMNARVADVMTRDVVAVRTDASFKEIAAMLRSLQLSAFPVLDDDDKVIGVVSETDLLPKEALEAGFERHRGWRSARRHRPELAKALGVTAADLMSRPPVTIGPYDLVSHAAHLMYDHRITRLPVVGAGGKLTGIISRSDVLSVFSRPDEEIRREITEKIIVREFRADPALVTVTVTDGVVTLASTPETAIIGHKIAGEVRHMEGVVAVRERVSHPPGESGGGEG
jgi:CBS-domain-containing membrane protein